MVTQHLAYGRARWGALAGVARGAWIALAVMAICMALGGVVPYAHRMGVVCDQEPCLAGQVRRTELDAFNGEGGLVLTSSSAMQDTTVAGLAAAVAILVAGLGIWRRPRDPAVALLAFVLLAFGSAGFATALAMERPGFEPGAVAIRIVYYAGLGSSLWLLPDAARRPRSLWPLVLAGSLLGALCAVDPRRVGHGVAFSLVIGAIVVIGLTSRYRSLPAGPEREGVTWTALAAAMLGGAQILGRPIAPLPLPRVEMDGVSANTFAMIPNVGMTLLVGAFACLAVATLRGELIDAEVVLNRTLVYALLTICIVGGYVVVVGSLSAVFQTRGNFWLSLVATGVVALAVEPARRRVQRLAHVLLYGARDEPYAVTARLGQQLESALPGEAVLPAIVRTVAADLKLPYVAIVLREADGSRRIAAAAGTSPGERMDSVPLVYQGERLGDLVVAARSGESQLATGDRQLLSDLARQAGAAARAVRLTGALQRAREELVAAREEERLRLRRDLHDGLGPELAAIAMLGDAARGMLHEDPEDADALLAELTDQARATIGDVRRLIHALRPPVLDELGLAVALRALATSFATTGPVITMEVADSLPRLPAAVEVTAYRIVQEALTNAVRHAGARHCIVSLTCDRVVSIRVSDDGRGVPIDRAPGVGLISMRERAEELGGSFEVRPGVGKGTVVSAELPTGRDDGTHSPADC